MSHFSVKPRLNQIKLLNGPCSPAVYNHAATENLMKPSVIDNTEVLWIHLDKRLRSHENNVAQYLITLSGSSKHDFDPSKSYYI